MRLVSANGIRDRDAEKWLTRLSSANGICDRDIRKWITRLASANDIRDRDAEKWVIRLDLANASLSLTLMQFKISLMNVITIILCSI